MDSLLDDRLEELELLVSKLLFELSILDEEFPLGLALLFREAWVVGASRCDEVTLVEPLTQRHFRHLLSKVAELVDGALLESCLIAPYVLLRSLAFDGGDCPVEGVHEAGVS